MQDDGTAGLGDDQQDEDQLARNPPARHQEPPMTMARAKDRGGGDSEEVDGEQGPAEPGHRQDGWGGHQTAIQVSTNASFPPPAYSGGATQSAADGVTARSIGMASSGYNPNDSAHTGTPTATPADAVAQHTPSADSPGGGRPTSDARGPLGVPSEAHLGQIGRLKNEKAEDDDDLHKKKQVVSGLSPLKALDELDKPGDMRTHSIEIRQIGPTGETLDLQNSLEAGETSKDPAYAHDGHEHTGQPRSRTSKTRKSAARRVRKLLGLREPIATVSSYTGNKVADHTSRHPHARNGSHADTAGAAAAVSTANTNLSIGGPSTVATSGIGLLDGRSSASDNGANLGQEARQGSKKSKKWMQRHRQKSSSRGVSLNDHQQNTSRRPPFFSKTSSSDSGKSLGASQTQSMAAASADTRTTITTTTTAMDNELGHNVDNKTGVLRRTYDTWSLIALTLANIGPIAGALFGVHTAREYGGYSMLAVGWPISGLFMCLFSASLAELSSSYPVAGAMFTWTFRACRLSPTLRPFARFLSWLCGSLLLCGHVLSQMLLEYQIATVLQGLIVIFARDYRPDVWKTIALAWGCLLISALIASTRVGRSPKLWKGVSILVLATTILIVASLFSQNTFRNPASVIFTCYRNRTGWSSKGYVYLLGWVLTSIATGQDVASHLAEEAKRPTKTVPLGVFWGTFLSYLVGWIVMLSVMAVAPEEAHNLNTRDFGAPAQMLTSLLPRPLAFLILLFIVILMIAQDTAQLLASSRFLWALARDSAIPFSSYFRHLSPKSRLPKRATWIVCVIAAPCLLLIAGSSQIVTSLILAGCGTSLVLAYVMPVLCYLACPKGALDIDGRNEWTLRGASKYIGAIGSLYIGLIIVMMCCPHYFPITSTSFSYAAPVIVFVLFLSSMTWVFYGNSHYAGPIKSITVYTIGREVELPKLTTTSSTNRATPHSARPSDPRGVVGANAFSDPTATTGFEVGKTANLFSESLATLDLRRPPETQDLSQELVTRSWQGGDARLESGRNVTDATGTQHTDYTEYSDDYTDGSGSESGSESSGSSRASSHRPPRTMSQPALSEATGSSSSSRPR